MTKFLKDIEKFNEMYRLPNNTTPTNLGPERAHNFKKILLEEVEEGEQLAMNLEDKGFDLDTQAELADWLGDIIVYCASEARRWGIPMDKTLEIIMESNFSKLDSAGQPVYDERGKVLKAESYWRPETKLKTMLNEHNK
jgi:predicted HAD superfamily Cof-like phosphohydrolase